jgi:adenylate cyclase
MSANVVPLRRPAEPETPDITEWLGREASRLGSAAALMQEMCDRLLSEGLPLFRVTCMIRTLHPTLVGTTAIWRKDQEWPTEFAALQGIVDLPQFKASPLPVIFEGAAAIRRRLDVPGLALDFPILEDLKAEGATDYLALPLTFSDGSIHFFTWTADRPNGFTTAELTRIYDLMPLVALNLEVFARRQLTENLLTTYLGRDAGLRVLKGAIHRGDGETIRAAIWLCDLRGFTALSDRLPRDELIALLNDFSEQIVIAVDGNGGEVLKFLGDGLLAIFPMDGDSSPEAAARSALAAADHAQRRLAKLNAARRDAGKAELRMGIALHAGDVMYGNIGGRRRLDFTVTGPAVNQAARIEAMTKVLGCAVLLSAECAELCRQPLTSLGFHGLRGIPEPVELFTPIPR